MIRVVLYLNQFFGGIGGEDKADLPPRLTEEIVGPGKAFRASLGDQGQVVATVICGDNYFAENIEAATREVKELDGALPARPSSCRTCVQCGAVRHRVRGRVQDGPNRTSDPGRNRHVPGKPGARPVQEETYTSLRPGILRGPWPTSSSRMTALAWKLLRGEKIGKPADEGYFPRGLLVNEVADKTGAERVMDMLLRKLRGRAFRVGGSPAGLRPGEARARRKGAPLGEDRPRDRRRTGAEREPRQDRDGHRDALWQIQYRGQGCARSR